MKLLTTIFAVFIGVLLWAQTPPSPDEKSTIPGSPKSPIDDFIMYVIPVAILFVVVYWILTNKRRINA